MTLLEIMIVIFLIGLIASVVGYNMKGSLDEGKAFKTRQAKEQVADILLLQYANHNFAIPLEEIAKDAEKYLKESGMVKKANDLLLDGWGKRLEIKVVNGDLKVSSKSLEDYEKKKNKNQKPVDLKEDEEE
jgi:type II secretory pathway pseudopilin PulG